MANIGNHTFIDGVGDIRLLEGIVRIDLLALSPMARDKDGNPTAAFVDQLVMSPAAFLRMVSAMGATVRQMQEKGLLSAPAEQTKKEPEAKAAPNSKDEAPAKSRKAKKASPNF